MKIDVKLEDQKGAFAKTEISISRRIQISDEQKRSP